MLMAKADLGHSLDWPRAASRRTWSLCEIRLNIKAQKGSRNGNSLSILCRSVYYTEFYKVFPGPLSMWISQTRSWIGKVVISVYICERAVRFWLSPK